MKRNLLLYPAAALLIGCVGQPIESPPAPSKASASYLTSEEILSHVTGNTEEWSKGAGYYAGDGNLLGKWEERNIKGTWTVKDSEMCIKIDSWQGEDCHQYKRDNGKILLVYEGNSSERAIKTGNQLLAF